MQFSTLTLAIAALLFSGAEAATLKNRQEEGQPCLPMCQPSEPTCGDLFYSKQMTESCWTCCVKTSGDNKAPRQESEGSSPVINADKLDELLKLLNLDPVREVVNTDKLDELINTIAGDDDGNSPPPVIDTGNLDDLIDLLGLAAVGKVVNTDSIDELINSIIGDDD